MVEMDCHFLALKVLPCIVFALYYLASTILTLFIFKNDIMIGLFFGGLVSLRNGRPIFIRAQDLYYTGRFKQFKKPLMLSM